MTGRTGVQSVEEDQVVSIGQFYSDDLLLDQQWAIRAVQLPWAWTRTQGNAGTKLCVVDTGIDASHPDLIPNIQSGRHAQWRMPYNLQQRTQQGARQRGSTGSSMPTPLTKTAMARTWPALQQQWATTA